uniref:Uncharacterized protein n=1 Tax=Anguilla anguilla TaxID=7936 RepID=A0A0E9TGP0_ANGAN
MQGSETMTVFAGWLDSTVDVSYPECVEQMVFNRVKNKVAHA